MSSVYQLLLLVTYALNGGKFLASAHSCLISHATVPCPICRTHAPAGNRWAVEWSSVGCCLRNWLAYVSASQFNWANSGISSYGDFSSWCPLICSMVGMKVPRDVRVSSIWARQSHYSSMVVLG